MQRRHVDTMVFPAKVLPVDLPALAEVLGDRHGATIASSDGVIELRFHDPSSLIAVLSSTRVDFFEDLQTASLPDESDDDPAHAAPEEESVETGVELAVHTIEAHLGLFVEDDEDVAERTPEDDDDRQADKVLAALLKRGSIELVAPRSRAGVQGKLAHLISRGSSAAAVLDGLTDHEGVAEIYADEAQIESLLSAARRARR